MVARQLHITSCCGESFCHGCISDVLKQKPCPACKEEKFVIFSHVRNQREITGLGVHCTLKEKGCNWSGTLDQLASHLDPDQDNCQYVDTECPLKCMTTVSRKDLEQHLTQQCAQRPFSCRHCSHSGTFQEVTEQHIPKCKYVPMQCPNLCGVTFEREHFQDHIKICRLQKLDCDFSSVGCNIESSREDHETHLRDDCQRHLKLTASFSLDLQRKMAEWEEQMRKENEGLRRKLEEQEELNQRLLAQVCGLNEAEKEMRRSVDRLGEQFDFNLQMLTQQFLGVMNKSIMLSSVKAQELATPMGLNRSFEVRHFKSLKAKDQEWKSLGMYTHVFGCKFCVGVVPNGRGNSYGQAISVDIWSMPGEYDEHLNWPARAKFTLELASQCGGQSLKCTSNEMSWPRPSKAMEFVVSLGDVVVRSGGIQTEVVSQAFVMHSDLCQYLLNDSLHFSVSKISRCFR